MAEAIDPAVPVPDPTTPTGGDRTRLLQWWRGVNDWWKALLFAFLLLLLAHAFVLRWVTVQSTSMYHTLWPGDLVGVYRWPAWSGFHRGDVVVFHDPVQDDRAMARRQLLVKRIVGMPGDEVRIRDGQVLVNGTPVAPPPGGTHSWLVRLKRGTDPHPLFHDMGLPPAYEMPERTEVEMPLNDSLAAALRKRPEVVSAEPLPLARGHAVHLFPFSPNYAWNSDNYGPIDVPKAGDTVRLDVGTLPLYDRLITRYEKQHLEAVKNDLYLNGRETDRYVVQQDYYFVLGDSRHYSSDSRSWGFVPADHLVGRAGFVLLSTDPGGGGLRDRRWFRAIP